MPNRRSRGGRRPTNHIPTQQAPHIQPTPTQQPRNPRRRSRQGSSNPRPRRRSQRQVRSPSISPPYTPSQQRRHNEHLGKLNAIHEQGTNALRELGDLMDGVRAMQNEIQHGQSMDWEPHSTIVFERADLSPRTTLVGSAASTRNAGRQAEPDGPVSPSGLSRSAGAQPSVQEVLGGEIPTRQADGGDASIAEE